MIQSIQTRIARALVRVAILAAPPDLAADLREALVGDAGAVSPNAAGGPGAVQR